MRPIKRGLSDKSKASLTASANVLVHRYYERGYSYGWRRGFKIGAPLAFAATTALWAIVLGVVLFVRGA